MLTRVITNLVRGGNATKGVNKQTDSQIAEIVDSILDWRDTDSLERTHGAERKWYRSKRGYPAEERLLRLSAGAAAGEGCHGGAVLRHRGPARAEGRDHGLLQERTPSTPGPSRRRCSRRSSASRRPRPPIWSPSARTTAPTSCRRCRPGWPRSIPRSRRSSSTSRRTPS